MYKGWSKVWGCVDTSARMLFETYMDPMRMPSGGPKKTNASSLKGSGVPEHIIVSAGEVVW
jgi:hypothetical protein